LLVDVPFGHLSHEAFPGSGWYSPAAQPVQSVELLQQPGLQQPHSRMLLFAKLPALQTLHDFMSMSVQFSMGMLE
jgi:hypothetical protein